MISRLAEHADLVAEREKMVEERDGAYNDMNLLQMRVNWHEANEGQQIESIN